MSNPVVADIKPAKVSLEQGKDYFFCACGRSKKQPFCDASHAGTPYKALRFTAEKSGNAYLCQCKQTGNSPFCDGSHKQVDASQIGN